MSCDSTCDISLPGENSATQTSSHQNPGKISISRENSATQTSSHQNPGKLIKSLSFFDKLH